MKKHLMIILAFMSMYACSQTTEKKLTEENKILQLSGYYNAKDDIWENPDPHYSDVISFDKQPYAAFYKFDQEENILGIGLINKKGKVIIQPVYNGVGQSLISKIGLFEVSDAANKYGLVNKDGIEIAAPQFDFIYLGTEMDSLEEKMGLIKVLKNQKKGYINTKGAFVIPVKYDDLFLMGGNLMMFETLIPTDDKGSNISRWGIMDFNQKVISNAIFGYPDKFENGKVTLIADGKQYTVYENGSIKKE